MKKLADLLDNETIEFCGLVLRREASTAQSMIFSICEELGASTFCSYGSLHLHDPCNNGGYELRIHGVVNTDKYRITIGQDSEEVMKHVLLGLKPLLDRLRIPRTVSVSLTFHDLTRSPFSFTFFTEH